MSLVLEGPGPRERVCAMLEEAEKGNGDLGSAADAPDHHGIWVEVLKEILTTAFVLGRSCFCY